MTDQIKKTDAQWREMLDPEQFRVARMKGTERPFTGEYWNVWDAGDYRCRCCGAGLFHSEAKFDAGCGWPSFHSAAAPENVAEIRDVSHGMVRTEVVCQKCDAHLGHVFTDGPEPTGLRYCINSASIKLDKS